MGYTLEIDGVVAAPMRLGSVGKPVSGTRNQNLSDSLSFSTKTVTTGTLSPPYQVGDLVELTESTTGDKIFSGFIRRLAKTEVTDSPTTEYMIVYSYDCVDHSAVPQRRVINEAWDNTAFEDIIAGINTNWLDGEGITVNNVAAGPIITRAAFSWRTVARAFDDLAEQVGYSWWIDQDKDLHFVPRGTDLASIAFTPTNRPFIKLGVTESLQQYSNVVVQQGGIALTTTQTESLIGDGVRRVFSLSYPVGEKPTSIVAAGITILSSEIGILELETGKKWYYNAGNAELTQDETETVLTAPEELVVQYKGQYRVVTQAENTLQIAARAAVSSGTSGRYETVLIDQSLDSLQLAADKASGYIRKFGLVPESINFTTFNQTLRPGQLLSIELPELGVNGDYLIDEVTFRDRGDDTFVWSVTALSGESLGGWVAFWRRLTQPTKLLIGDDFIIDLQQLTTVLTLALAETATEQATVYHTWDVTHYGLAEVSP